VKTSAALAKLIVFMVITSMLTFTLAATIGNFSLGSSTTYHAAFSDVTGLLPGNEVRISGVKVGKVGSITLKGKLADVVLTLEGDRKIADSSVLRLRYRNLVGERYIAINEGPGSTSARIANKDAVIGRVIDNLTSVLTTVDDRDTQLNDLITQLQRLAKGFAMDRQSIGESIQGISSLTDATAGLIKDVRPGVRNDVVDLQRLAKNLDDNKAVVDGVLQRLPDKLNRIVSTATYSSWFNFYLCGVDVRTSTPLGAITTPQVVNSAPRCNR